MGAWLRVRIEPSYRLVLLYLKVCSSFPRTYSVLSSMRSSHGTLIVRVLFWEVAVEPKSCGCVDSASIGGFAFRIAVRKRVASTAVYLYFMVATIPLPRGIAMECQGGFVWRGDGCSIPSVFQQLFLHVGRFLESNTNICLARCSESVIIFKSSCFPRRSEARQLKGRIYSTTK